jgi:NAD(P)-dependent dehydrogenase (short-subunit alcohol dehydrogenase family)
MGCRHAIPPMLDRGGGAIVNTASIEAFRARGVSALMRAVGRVQAGAIVRRMTVFFIPLERTNSKSACSYIVRVPL